METAAQVVISSGGCADLSSNHCRQRTLVHLAVAIGLAVDTANRTDHEVGDNEGPLRYVGTSAKDARRPNATGAKQVNNPNRSAIRSAGVVTADWLGAI